MTTRRILAFLFSFSFLVLSCTKKEDVIEIYLTKNKIESYNGVPLRVGIKDNLILKNVVDFYGTDIRVDTITEKLIYMGHFNVQKEDLEEKPFIINSEILGFDFEKSEIHLSKNAEEKIYNTQNDWRKNTALRKQFAICYNGAVVLTGYLIPSICSHHSNTYQIWYNPNITDNQQNEFKASQLIMTDSLNFEKNYLLKDKIFYNTFKNRIIRRLCKMI